MTTRFTHFAMNSVRARSTWPAVTAVLIGRAPRALSSPWFGHTVEPWAVAAFPLFSRQFWPPARDQRVRGHTIPATSGRALVLIVGHHGSNTRPISDRLMNGRPCHGCCTVAVATTPPSHRDDGRERADCFSHVPIHA